jgi:hypothetical protein
MTADWYPGIRDFCFHWRDASMLQETFAAMEKAFGDNNHACIDSAKAMVEVACRIIVGDLLAPGDAGYPNGSTPDFGDWLSGAVRALKLGDVRHDRFRKLVSAHHKLTTALGDLRNAAGPTSHGRDGFIAKLSDHHRRAAVLSADALITFLHAAYLEAEPNILRTHEPYESFESMNAVIDARVSLSASTTEEGTLEVVFGLPGGDEILLDIEPSRILFQIDRQAYLQALAACREAAAVAEELIKADEAA